MTSFYVHSRWLVTTHTTSSCTKGDSMEAEEERRVSMTLFTKDERLLFLTTCSMQSMNEFRAPNSLEIHKRAHTAWTWDVQFKSVSVCRRWLSSREFINKKDTWNCIRLRASLHGGWRWVARESWCAVVRTNFTNIYDLAWRMNGKVALIIRL